MDVVEVSAKTVDEAVEKALEEMGADRDEVKITVLSEGKSGGFFGIGAEDARVKVERLTPGAVSATTESTATETAPAISPGELARTAAETLDKLVKLMDVEGQVVALGNPGMDAEGNIAQIGFNIEGDDLGILIGRRGQTLASLQYILRLIVGHQTKIWTPIIVDAEGYKQRRYEALRALALRMADHVKQRGAPFTLEPMPPYERRIIHLTLADNPAVYTESTGEAEARKVVIKPKNPGVRQPAERNGNTSQAGDNYARRGTYGSQQRTGGGYDAQRSGYGGGQRSGGYSRPRRQSPPPY